MSKIHFISPKKLTINHIGNILSKNQKIKLSPESKELIIKCRNYLNRKLDESDQLIYGINTGFGSLYNIRISKKETQTLQNNLVKSHACGTGDEVPSEIVKIMLFLKIQSLSYGYSAAQLKTVELLMDFFNKDVYPIIFQQGSLGASGDLAPLAHLSLPLIGLGNVYHNAKKINGKKILKKIKKKSISLQSKEGLALLNGTQFSSAYGVWSLLESKRLLNLANITAALSLDAFDCQHSPFNSNLHRIRPHKGQIKIAKTIRTLLKGSQITKRKKEHVQDPYAFRCVPQVHGASYDAIEYVEKIFVTEINSVTDNPNVFPDNNLILSGGNFHAQPLAITLDFLAIALAELGSISERRTFQLISGVRDLPKFLIKKAGLNSGLMIPQYTAASIASQNKQLCSPASVDSIVSSNGQEDHVSMAANAATKTYRVVKNLERIIAIEFMTAAQALHFRRPALSSPNIEKMIKAYRKVVPVLKEDRILSDDIQATIKFLKTI